MTPSQRRYYDANKGNPEFKARRLAAVNRYDEANKGVESARKRVSVEPVVGERFEDWLQRWGEVEGRALFSVLAAARHQRAEKAAEARKRSSAKAIERVRAGKGEQVVQLRLASWRQPGEFGLVNSVFALGAASPVTPAWPVTPVQGAGAERREGDEVHLKSQQYKDTTWRAPWGPGYALHRPKSTS